LAQFDLGVSVYSGRPVATMILQRAEPTLMLALTTTLLSVLVAVPAGVFAARRLGLVTDYLVMALCVAGFSIPVFVIGYALMQVFAIELGWLPVQGYRPLASGLWNSLRSLTLPTVALTLLFAALVARITRATLLNVLSEDYIRTARAKGLPERKVVGDACAEEYRRARGDRRRHLFRGPARRGRRHRIRLQSAGGRAPDRRCHPVARLSGRAGGDAGLRLRPGRGEPARRSQLCAVRPPHPAGHALMSAQPQMARAGRSLKASTVVIGLSFAVVAAVAACALLAPPILGYSSDLNMGEALQPPGAAHWFGTDNLGRDIFVRTLSGARTSLMVGLGVSVLTLLAGGLIGLVAGYVRMADTVLMRIMDGLMAIPGVLLAIALASLLGGGLATVMIAISVPEIPRTARLMRGVVLSLREMPYVDAAIAIGSSTPRVLLRHILPNATEALVVQATLRLRFGDPRRSHPQLHRRRHLAGPAELGATSWPAAASSSASRPGSSPFPACSCRCW
jgi:peptide/nickel transport system permease protein